MTLFRVFIIYTAVCSIGSATDETTTQKPVEESLEQAETSGLYGVASVAGIASRNGRVSSISGIQIYPGVEKPLSINAGNFFNPLSIESSRNLNLEALEWYPGSIFVSPTANPWFQGDKQLTQHGATFKKPLLPGFRVQPLPEIFHNEKLSIDGPLVFKKYISSWTSDCFGLKNVSEF